MSKEITKSKGSPVALTPEEEADIKSEMVGFVEVATAKTYLRADALHKGKGQAVVLPLARSGDVRALYPNADDDSPCHVWALQLRHPMPEGSGLSQGEGNPVAGRRGEIVYFFEPKNLATVLQSAKQCKFLVTIEMGPGDGEGDGKRAFVMKKGKQAGKKFRAWDWKVGCNPKPFDPVGNSQLAVMGLPGLVAPETLEAAQLPAGASADAPPF